MGQAKLTHNWPVSHMGRVKFCRQKRTLPRLACHRKDKHQPIKASSKNLWVLEDLSHNNREWTNHDQYVTVGSLPRSPWGNSSYEPDLYIWDSQLRIKPYPSIQICSAPVDVPSSKFKSSTGIHNKSLFFFQPWHHYIICTMINQSIRIALIVSLISIRFYLETINLRNVRKTKYSLLRKIIYFFHFP